MRHLFSLVVLAVFASCAQRPQTEGNALTASSKLVEIIDGGEFIEIQRAPNYSTVEIRGAPTGSVPSSMFALRGSCAVARARGERFFSSKPVMGVVRTYTLTFPKSPADGELTGPSKSVFSVADCTNLRF